MKPYDVKPSAFVDFGIENNEKDSKFKVGDFVRISKHKNIFVKGYTPNHHGAEISVIWLVQRSPIKSLILIRY